MKTEEQIREHLEMWKEGKKEHKKYGQETTYESICIACFEWVLEE